MRTQHRYRGGGKAVPLIILGAVVIVIAGGLGWYFLGQQMPEDVVREFVAADEEGDSSRMRACLTEGTTAQVIDVGFSPLKVVNALPGAEVKSATVGDAHFDGDAAIVPVDVELSGKLSGLGISKIQIEYRLVKEAGAWKIQLERTKTLVPGLGSLIPSFGQ